MKFRAACKYIHRRSRLPLPSFTMTSSAHYVVLHIGAKLAGPSETSLAFIGENGRFDITADIWIERLDSELAKRIISACEPRGIIETIPTDRHLYAWVRRTPERESRRYEGLQPLLNAIVLSRFIHPTNTGLRYCAWLSDLSADARIVSPISFTGISPDVLLAPETRNWLTEANGREVKELSIWLMAEKMHERVRRAYWNHEYALRLAELDIRWPLIVGAFEALITNDKEDSLTWQFKDRVSRLAAHFCIPLSEADLGKMYDVRSKLVHGEKFLHALGGTVPVVEQPALYQKLETLLRLTVKACLSESAFYDHFRDARSVTANWPLRPNPSAKANGKSKRKRAKAKR